MKIWTYQQLSDKIIAELDLEDEQFVTPMELIGYVNKAISLAESAILKIDEDYFLSLYYPPLVAGVRDYDYPYDCYAQKIRGLQYVLGTTVYPIQKFRRWNKFDNVEMASLYPLNNQYYNWTTVNESQMNPKIRFIPGMFLSANVTYPNELVQTAPIKVWYIRHANRIPLLSEIVKVYEQFGATQVSVANHSVAITKSYVTGDKVSLSVYGGSVPTGLTAGTQYFAILNADGTLSFATTLVNATAGNKIAFTTTGSGVMQMGIIASNNTIMNTLIDLPECAEFLTQSVKVDVYNKEMDQRLPNAITERQSLYNDMVAALTEKEQDDDTRVEMDLSSYWETS